MSDTKPIGIRFEFSRKYLNHFAQLFESISVEKYTWYVSCSENYLSCNGEICPFLPNGVYSGREFASIIRSASNYYVHLVCLFAVPVGDKFNPSIIDSYKDYIKSSAEIALLSADSYVDLYVKDYSTLKNIVISCNKYYSNGTISPQYITLQNDEREKFEV